MGISCNVPLTPASVATIPLPLTCGTPELNPNIELRLPMVDRGPVGHVQDLSDKVHKRRHARALEGRHQGLGAPRLPEANRIV